MIMIGSWATVYLPNSRTVSYLQQDTILQRSRLYATAFKTFIYNFTDIEYLKSLRLLCYIQSIDRQSIKIRENRTMLRIPGPELYIYLVIIVDKT